MSGPNAVWPDGTRWAVGQAHDQWMKRSQFDPTSVATDILTALEPFVQQRIADATQRLCAAHTGIVDPGKLLSALQTAEHEASRLRAEVRHLQVELNRPR